MRRQPNGSHRAAPDLVLEPVLAGDHVAGHDTGVRRAGRRRGRSRHGWVSPSSARPRAHEKWGQRTLVRVREGGKCGNLSPRTKGKILDGAVEIAFRGPSAG